MNLMRSLLLFSLCWCLLLVGCSGKQKAPSPLEPTTASPPPPPPPSTELPEGHPIVVARDLLVGSSAEEPGFGMYSYILFGYPPLSPSDKNSNQYQRAAKTAEAFLQMDAVSDIRRNGINPAEINLTYFPVIKPPGANTADAFLMVYNYPRSHAILGLTGKSGAGPYILSALIPLTGVRSFPSHYLLQDLSEVPPRLVGLWVQHFREQSTQPRFWERPEDEFKLKLRTSIGEVTDEMFAAVIFWHIGRSPS